MGSTAQQRLCFLRGPCRGVILKTIGVTRQTRIQLWCVNQRTTEAEESPSLRFVTRKRLVKTLHMNSTVESCYHVNTSENTLRRLRVG
jgi:hypothetical protein